MKEMKRTLSLVLCFAMFVGMLPMFALNADAAGDTHYLMFATDRHANTSVIGNVINNMESVIGENKLEYLALGGDMVGSGNTHPTYSSSTVLAEVTAATSSLNAGNVDIVAGNHDMNVNDDAGIVLPYQGGGAQIYEGDDYYVYGVEEYCISEDSNEANWSAQAQAFVDWANGENIDKSKVIFVVSHYPLHAKRDDNDGAYYWHQALNTVATGAASGDSTVERDIVFFHGHNHTTDSNEYVYTVGDKMSIQNGSSTVSDTIYYTYATAGYLNQNKKATLVTLTDDAIVLTKYSASGSGTAMTTVERVVTETAPTTNTVSSKTTYLDEDGDVQTNGNTVTATGLGLTAVSALWNEEAAANEDFRDCVAYDVTLGGYIEGEEVTLTFNLLDMTADELVVYMNGSVILPDAVTANEDGSVNVTVTMAAAEATFVIGYLAAAEDAVLTGIEVTTMPNVTSYTLVIDEAADGNIYLDITGLVITSIYDNDQKIPVEWNRFGEIEDGYALTFNMTVAGEQNVVVTYGGFETSFPITIYAHNAVDADVDAYVAEVLEDGYIAKEFAPTDYVEGTDIRVVMPAPENADVVYHVADDGTLTEVENVTFQDGYAIFDTDHFSAYVAGRSTLPWVTIQAPGEYTVYKYTQVDTVASGNAYVIVGYGSSAALNVDKSVQTVTVNGTEITSTEELNLWTFTAATNGYTINSNGTYLMYQNGLSTGGTQADWFVTNESGLFQAYLSVGSYGNRYLYTNGTSWAMGETSDGLSLYAYSGTGTEYADDGLFARMDGTTAYTVTVGTSMYDVEQVIKGGITVYTTTDTSTEGTAIDDSAYTLTTDYTNNSGEGKYTVSVVYNELVLGTVTLTVAGIPEGEKAEGSETTPADKKFVYLLTTQPSAGNSYLIVNGNAAGSYYALANNNGSVAATGVTVKTDSTIGTYIELADATDELWTVGGSYTFQNGSYYLGYTEETTENWWGGTSTSYEFGLTTTARTWSYSTSNHRLSTTADSTYYLRYNSGWTWNSNSNRATSIYFYTLTEVEVTPETTVSGTYSIEGEDQTVVVSEEVMDTVLSSKLTFTPADGGEATTETIESGAIYTVHSDPGIIESLSEDGFLTFTGTYGTAVIKVTKEVTFGTETKTVTDYFTVTATAPYYGIQLHKAELTQVSLTADTFASGVYYTFNSTTNTYHVAESYAEDATYYTAFTVASVTEETFANGIYYTYDATSKIYSIAESYVDGTVYYTYAVKAGDEITTPVALKGIKAGDTYSVWAVVKEYDGIEDENGEDGVDQGDLGDDLTWSVSDESIATIDSKTGIITFTGTNYGTFTVTVAYTGADGKPITDTITISAEDSLYVVPGDGTDDFPEYPNEGAVRFDKTATAVGNFSETGIALVELSMTGVPYSTDNAMDVVVMLDMTGSMSTNGMEAAELATIAFVEKIVKNEDGTYNDNRVAVYAFNSSSSSPFELVALTTIKSDTALATANTAIKTASDKKASGGTPFDEATAKCQEVLNAAKTTNLPEGVESAEDYNRQQFCVFMSDGGPTAYRATYNNTNGYLDISNSGSGTSAITTYFSGYNSSTSSSWNFTLPSEYYTDQMKADGVTIYTVGLLLQNKPSNPSPYSSMTASTMNDDGTAITTVGSHYYFTSRVLKQMATDESKYIDIFNVDNADDATAKFTAIAQSILEAATNVEVEDKIGNNYSVNFSIPGYGTNNAVSSDALDGTTEFYIQVVEYQLNADKERTGDPAVLENFTFNANGTLKSHTVDGVACSGCTHVSTNATTGAITAIDGTYFDYKSDSTGEYLNWTAEKLTTTELALQYFAHLDKSTGVTTAEQIAAGTYYTNEYATLTYDNYKGERVQQEFPVPQMTWNGAQVHYVFYLVNEAGQPVNTAGRVVPFAEAVYVTDVYHYQVIWSDLEQTTGLSANYLAEQLVPEVYELYDDDASYELHVYEKENAVNLNNHFIIGGDVTDDESTGKGWTNAKTTYVFNTKADGTKYNVVGAYIANDGVDTTTSTTYLCKSAAIKNATYTTSTDVGGNTTYTVTSLGDGYQAVAGETQVPASEMESTTGGTIIDGYVYYVSENGVVYTIVRKSNGTEVREGFDFHNTTVAFAVVWKPELKEDTVVVDYGLDVLIDVTTNDTMAAGVVGVRTTAPDANTDGTYERDEANTLESVDVVLNGLTIGTASVENLNTIRFSLDKTNGIQFNKPVSFFYESDVNFYNSSNTLVKASMYSKVTVIPATTVYYEDDFMTFKTFGKYSEITLAEGYDTSIEYYTLSNGNYAKVAADALVVGEKYYYVTWAEVDSTWATKAQNGTQAQDRPGASKISAALDADNNYGYDKTYEKLSTFSLNSAAQITVDANTRGEATFTFWGTGFDVIGLTSSSTGAITVLVKEVGDVDGDGKENETVKNALVDTYYGMDADGNVDTNNPDALYQVPVIKIYGLGYGKYTVKITAGYNAIFDHEAGSTSYDLYLDAIRVYNPTGNQDETANDAYKADGEAYPRYETIRDKVIAASNFTVTEDPETGKITVTATEGATNLTGPIFIDCNNGTTSIAEYVSFGPNNELYLANNQAIAFNVAMTATVADVQLGIKIAGGGSVTYEINGDTYTVNTATDLYYSILKYAKAGTVTIKNVSGGILSLTNIKVTYTQDPGTTTSLMSMDAESAGIALMSLRRAPVVEETEPTVPETTVPETTVPETTEPETTETTEPETTEPETTEPEETKPESSSREEELIKVIGKIIRGILGRIFG